MDQHTPSTEHTAAHAPHRALDPSRPALLPRLIDDVLLAILDELAQLDFTAKGSKLRQQTLRSVCLASRRLCALARPFLWRQVVVSESKQLEQLRQSGAVLGACTTTYTIRTEGGCDVQTALSTGAAALPNVEQLTLRGARGVGLSLSWLQGYPNLRRLELYDLDPIRVDLSPPPTLPHLEVLLFVNCEIAPGHPRGWLSSAWLPSLKVLSVVPTRFTLAAALSPCLAKQLDVLQVSTSANTRIIGPCATSLSPAIVVFNPFLNERLEFNSMFTHEPYFYGHAPPALSRLMTLIANEPQADAAAPRVLMLSIQARDANKSKARYALRVKPGTATWQGLEEVCRERGRRVIWYDEEAVDVVPNEFQRYVRELKARSLAESAA